MYHVVIGEVCENRIEDNEQVIKTIRLIGSLMFGWILENPVDEERVQACCHDSSIK